MQVATEPYRSMFCQLVGPMLNNLNQVPFGGKVLHNLLNKFPQLMKYRCIQNPQPMYYNYDYMNNLMNIQGMNQGGINNGNNP